MIIVIQWFHEFLGIFWFGSSLYLNFIVVPVILKLPLGQQREISVPLGILSSRVLLPVGILVIVLGALRGTVWGSVHSFATLFGTAYGLTFLLAFLIASGVVSWGELVVGKAALRLNSYPLAEVTQPGSSTALAFNAQVQRVKFFIVIESLGFLGIFTCMILMGFGM